MATKRQREKGRIRGLKTRRRRTAEFNDRMMGTIFAVFASKFASTLAGCAERLNERGYKTIWGKSWDAVSVRRVLIAHGHTAKSLVEALSTWARAKRAPVKCRRQQRGKLFHLISAARYYAAHLRDGSLAAFNAVQRTMEGGDTESGARRAAMTSANGGHNKVGLVSPSMSREQWVANFERIRAEVKAENAGLRKGLTKPRGGREPA